MTHHLPPPERRRDPLAAYRVALRDGDVRLAELLHRRFVAAAVAARILRTVVVRLGWRSPSSRRELP